MIGIDDLSEITDKLEFDDPDNDELNIDLYLDYDGFGWGSTCPASRSFSAGMVGSYSLDLSPFCTLAEVVGVFVIFAALTFSYRIIVS